jgi:hypothetical protein
LNLAAHLSTHNTYRERIREELINAGISSAVAAAHDLVTGRFGANIVGVIKTKKAPFPKDWCSMSRGNAFLAPGFN